MADIVNHQPLVTVGICCYNREEGFKNTLEYITGQTYKNLEIIISQDFNPSMDFAAIADAEDDERITFYKQPQRLSMYNNFRFLLEKANGDYFMWAADDDWWAPDFIEKIMQLLVADTAAVAGFSNFMEVDEDNNRITSYPNHLPLLQEFATGNDVKRIKNYINQFEGFGKANLFYAIFKTSELRSRQVIELLKEGYLPCDMLINLSVILKGKIAIVPELLRTCTVGNIKYYEQPNLQAGPVINLGIAYLNMGKFKHSYKWNRFIYRHFKIVNNSDISLIKKVALFPFLIRKLLFFYYDLVCVSIQLKGYNIFSRLKRKHILN